MTQEIKIGDRVAAEDAKYSGIVTAVDDIKCKVCFGDGEELWFLKDILHYSDLPDYDRKTAFLTELQALLHKHNAVMAFEADYGYSVGFSLNLGGEEVLHDKTVTEINADNIMDFEKE